MPWSPRWIAKGIIRYLAAVDGRSGSILFQVSEVADLDGTVRKARNDLQLPAHRLDVAAQRRDVHIRAPLELRDRGLLYVQGLCKHFLRWPSSMPQLVKGHFGEHFFRLTFGSRPRFR